MKIALKTFYILCCIACVGGGLWALLLGNWAITLMVWFVGFWFLVAPRYPWGRKMIRMASSPERTYVDARIVEYRHALQHVVDCDKCEACKTTAQGALDGVNRKEIYKDLLNS